MKKIVLIGFIFLLCSFELQQDSVECKKQSMVWICGSSSVYHSSSACLEIKNCSNAKQVSLTTAQSQGKQACGVCCVSKKKSNTTTKTQATKTKKSSSTTNQAKKTKTTTTTKTNQAKKTKK